MSIISGVKHAPRKGSSFKKSEQLPQFGIKIDKEPELASVSIYIIIIGCFKNAKSLKSHAPEG